jgi:hypothetical protein
MAEREIDEGTEQVVVELLAMEAGRLEQADVDIGHVRLGGSTIFWKEEVAAALAFLRGKTPRTRTSGEEELLKFLAEWLGKIRVNSRRRGLKTNHGWKKLPRAAAPKGRKKDLRWGQGGGYSPACFIPSNLSRLGMRDAIVSEAPHAPDAPEVPNAREPIPDGELTAHFEERAEAFHKIRPPDATDQEWAALEAGVLLGLSLREAAELLGRSHTEVNRQRNRALGKLAARVKFERLFAASDEKGKAQEVHGEEIGVEPKRGAGPDVFDNDDAASDDPGHEEE